MSRGQLIPALQKRYFLETTVFMKDEAPPHIAKPVANPPDDEDTTPSKDEDSQNSPGAGGAVLVRKTKDSNQRSPTNGEGEEELPPVDTLEACDKAAERLRELSNHLNDGEIPMDVLQQTVGYAVSVLEAIYMDETKYVKKEIPSYL
ncbi:putative phosphodiesterase 1c [Trichonephila clavipes]|nr:putative phosphodiesterase 1c [Trichonephila clavipes]